MRAFWRRLTRTWCLVRMYWNTTDGDWSTIVDLMRHQIRRTRLHIQRHHIISDGPRVCSQMLVVENLLSRLLEDPYFDLASARYPSRGRHWVEMVSSLESQDMTLLTNILRKHLKSWWD